jgi:hypothetical protein
MRVSNKADFFLFDVIILLLMDLIYYFICLLCYGNLIKKYRIAAILGCDLVIFKIFCPCV